MDKGGENDEELREIAKSNLERAELGDERSQQLLAKMYRHGLGVKKDCAEAEKWYLKAAEQGNVAAQLELADMYQKDAGPLQSIANAYLWYSLATNGGNKFAKDRLASLTSSLTAEQKADADKRMAEWRETHPRPPFRPETL